jgi:hypothetical protein
MLWTIAIILIALWLLGIMTAFTMGGFIHILLAAAVVVILVRVIGGFIIKPNKAVINGNK